MKKYTNEECEENYQKMCNQFADDLQKAFAKLVVNFPGLAETDYDHGDWEAGDAGACIIRMPSLERAKEILEDLDNENK